MAALTVPWPAGSIPGALRPNITPDPVVSNPVFSIPGTSTGERTRARHRKLVLITLRCAAALEVDQNDRRRDGFEMNPTPERRKAWVSRS